MSLASPAVQQADAIVHTQEAAVSSAKEQEEYAGERRGGKKTKKKKKKKKKKKVDKRMEKDTPRSGERCWLRMDRERRLSHWEIVMAITAAAGTAVIASRRHGDALASRWDRQLKT